MKWSRAALAMVIAVPVIALLVRSMGNDPRIIRSTLVGRDAPPFELAVLESEVLQMQEGDTIRLSDYLGEVVVLNFWASWCGPCRIEHPALTAVADAYRARGVRFLGVLYQDQPESARRWLDQLGEVYPTVLDPASRVAIEYGVAGIPETYFIARDGRVAHKYFGPLSVDTLVTHLDALLAEPAPAAESMVGNP
ncbi:MAG TPA: TlpA disulfide reductase family protein [Longimicrobiales bacterium]|nr:TlpA disulfide reductase family protein [Longimicrobiales bacterium]